MWDKLDIEIPFSEQYVEELSSSKQGERVGYVDIKNYEFRGVAFVSFDDNGFPTYDRAKSIKWESIPSSISQVAVGFFPDGNGFNAWPHVRVKASPAKILQGHNVFGSENLREGAIQMLAVLKMSLPRLSAHLDFDAAHVRYVDCTYSARVDSKYFRDRIFALIESTAKSRSKVNNHHQGYLQLAVGSEYNRQKVYEKENEVLEDLATARRRNHIHRVVILSDPKLLDFSKGLMRFEATVGHRQFERIGIPTRLAEFLKFHDWYQKTYNEPLCRYLWTQNFSPVLEQIEGHTMKNVDDNAIKLKIESKLFKVKDNGRICKRKANAVWNTYRAIKTEGYAQLASENNKTFFRNVNLLINEVGLSRAFLKSLDPLRSHDNVVPMVKLINIDFSQQRPDWYVEPKAGFDDERRLLRRAS